MTESWDNGSDDSHASEKKRNEAVIDGNSVVGDGVLCKWIERLETELSNRDTTIAELTRGIFSPSSEVGEIQDTFKSRKNGVDAKFEALRYTHRDHQHFQRIEALETEIFARDDLITSLRDRDMIHGSRFATQKSEWESLHSWIIQVEQNIGDSGYSDVIFDTDAIPPDSSAAFAPSISLADWEIERLVLIREVEDLRNALVLSRGRSDERNAQGANEVQCEPRGSRSLTPDIKEFFEIERENEQLVQLLRLEREQYDQLQIAHDQLVHELESRNQEVHETVAALQLELEQANRRVKTMIDRQESIEFEPRHPELLESDERIRAFRLHLDRIHSEELASRPPRGGLLGLRWFRGNRNTR